MTSGLLEDASFNQSPVFGDVDLFASDRPLADVLGPTVTTGFGRVAVAVKIAGHVAWSERRNMLRGFMQF